MDGSPLERLMARDPTAVLAALVQIVDQHERILHDLAHSLSYHSHAGPGHAASEPVAAYHKVINPGSRAALADSGLLYTLAEMARTIQTLQEKAAHGKEAKEPGPKA